MSNIKFSQLPVANTLESGSIVPIVTSGINYQINAENLQTYVNNTTGNMTAAYFIGDGSLLTGLPSSYTNANVFAYLGSNSNVEITTTGNVTATYFIGDGSKLTNLTGANVVGEVAVANTVSNPLQPNITALGTITSLTANAVTINGQLTANGNAQFNQDVYFAGNVTIPGNINVISGNSGQFFGDPATGFGALYAGLPAGYTLLNNEVMQFSDNFDGYTQVTHRNINGGQQATTDYVATADNGTDTLNYVDLGIAGSGYNGLLANNSLGNSLFANDSYLYSQGGIAGGNLVLGTIRSGAVVRIIAGESDFDNVRATFSSTGLSVNGNVEAESIIVNRSIIGSGASPAPVLSGFSSISTAGVQGNISASGNLLTAGYVSAVGNVNGANIVATYLYGDGSNVSNVTANPVNTIVNGTSNVTIANANANVTVNVGEAVYTFTDTGNLELPNTFTLSAASPDANIHTTNGLSLGATNNVVINSSDSTWTFDTTGNLTAPGAVNTALVQGDNFNGLALSAGSDYTANLQYAIIRQGAETTDVFITTGDATVNNLFVGNDFNYIGLSNTGGANILTNDPFGGSYLWDFTNAGQLNIPGGMQIYNQGFLQEFNQSLYTTVRENTPTGVVIVNNIENGGEVANTTLAENSFSINMDIASTVKSWTFDNTGNLTLPSDAFTVNYANGTPVSLSGTYDDANVFAYLGSNSNVVVTTSGNVESTGNVVGAYLYGDGSNITNVTVSSVDTIISDATITPSATNTQFNVIALSEPATVATPVGVAVDGAKLTIRIRDSGLAQPLTWSSVYQVIGTTLPTTTVGSKTVYVGCIYNDSELTWDVVSVAQQA